MSLIRGPGTQLNDRAAGMHVDSIGRKLRVVTNSPNNDLSPLILVAAVVGQLLQLSVIRDKDQIQISIIVHVRRRHTDGFGTARHQLRQIFRLAIIGTAQNRQSGRTGRHKIRPTIVIKIRAMQRDAGNGCQ